ncbi:MAG: Maf family nucleotide pyrophosphatase [Anaerohalosphaeraceae bacterium]|nr:Maf family nucleotide pyrophosphatase [Anaerohalosphaeraceae bacterium]
MTAIQNQKIKFILASASSQRKQLLSRAGYDFDVVVSDVDESKFEDHQSNLNACDYSSMLAMAKAGAVAKNFPDKLVVGADTVADFDGEIIGKAETPTHAREIIEKLFSTPHKIITAISMVKLDIGLELTDFASTTVFPVAMTAAQISEHIDSGTWKGKAGAYSIQADKDAFIKRIKGSRTNVMGLSMELFEKMITAVSVEINNS